MISLADLHGNANYNTLGSNLSLTEGSAKVWILNPSTNLKTVTLPAEGKLITLGVKFYLINISSNSIWLEQFQSETLSYRNIEAEAADDSLNASGGLNLFPISYWVTVDGFSNAANNGDFKVLKRVSGKLTLDASLANEPVAVPSIDPPQVTVRKKKVAKIGPNKAAIVGLYLTENGTRVWYARQVSYGAVRPFVHTEPRESICIAEPQPPDPPDPYTPPDPPIEGGGGGETPLPQDCTDLPGDCGAKTVTVSGCPDPQYNRVWSLMWDGTGFSSVYVNNRLAYIVCNGDGTWSAALGISNPPGGPLRSFSIASDTFCPPSGNYPIISTDDGTTFVVG